MSRDKAMRGDWDKRAQENAYHWVLSSQLDWDKDAYYKEGEKHIKQYVLPFFDQRGIPQERYGSFRVLDIGCGTGRLCRALAHHTKHVIGIDISTEMIEKAKHDNADQANIEFILGSGQDLSPLSENSIDFCFSFIVFQHIPSKPIIRRCFQEIRRVLKAGGHAKIQVRGSPGNPPAKVLWSRGYHHFYLALTLWKGWLPLPWIRRYDSVFGANYSEKELRKLISSLGFEEVETERETEKYLWVSMKKPEAV